MVLGSVVYRVLDLGKGPIRLLNFGQRCPETVWISKDIIFLTFWGGNRNLLAFLEMKCAYIDWYFYISFGIFLYSETSL